MYEYLSAETSPLKYADWALVFGRADELVAERAIQLLEDPLVDYALIIGGIGKDSRSLARLQIPEAHYIASLMLSNMDLAGDRIYVEPRPTNGGECWEMGIETLLKNNLPHEDLTVVIHPTSLRRIMAQGDTIMRRVGFEAKLQGTGTHYNFDPRNPVDQKEAVGELLRLADWPGKGFCTAQADLPVDLVQVARDYDSAWKAEKK